MRLVRRVAVTGLGAITPIGNDAPSTWEAAVVGRSGIDWITAFDPGDSPVKVAGEVKDWDPSGLGDARELRRLDRYVLLALGAAKEAVSDARRVVGAVEARVGILFGSAIGGIIGIAEQADVLRDRGPHRVSPTFIPSVLVDAIELEGAVVPPALQHLREEPLGTAASAGHR